MRILITGWRGANGPGHIATIRDALAEYVAPDVFFSSTDALNRRMAAYGELARSNGIPITVVHGRCPFGGVDLHAARAALDWGWEVGEYPAQWRGGKLLGPARNARMVASSADVCLAFPGPSSRGTWDCLRKAAEAGIPGRVYPLQPVPAPTLFQDAA